MSICLVSQSLLQAQLRELFANSKKLGSVSAQFAGSCEPNLGFGSLNIIAGIQGMTIRPKRSCQRYIEKLWLPT
jgi:hypothetical protein